MLRLKAIVANGAAYDPGVDSWTPITTNNAPPPLLGSSSVWTGVELVVIGFSPPPQTTRAAFGPFYGAAYDPLKDRWRKLTNGGTPSFRGDGGAAVWTGAEMLVFGGYDGATFVDNFERTNPQLPWTFYRKP